MTKILLQLHKGNMVSYVVWIEYSPRLRLGEYKIQTTYMRPYYLSWAEIINNIEVIGLWGPIYELLLEMWKVNMSYVYFLIKAYS